MFEPQSHIALALNHTFIDVALSALLIWPGSSNSPSSAATPTGVDVMGPDLSAGTAFPLAVVVQPTASVQAPASTRTTICWRIFPPSSGTTSLSGGLPAPPE